MNGKKFAYAGAKGGFNTEIGGVSATINTPLLLANKLGISVARVENFTIVGADIKCRITGGGYAIPNAAFDGSPLTYYNDTDGLVTSLGFASFKETNNISKIEFKNCTSILGEVARFSSIREWILPNCTIIPDLCWGNDIAQPTTIYIPRVTNLGSTVGNNDVFTKWNSVVYKLYVNSTMATVNGGSPDGDLVGLFAGSEIRYVTNFTAPNAISNLSAGTITATTIQLNFTPPSSTNAIDYYEVYVNGVFKQNITASGQNITGLTTGTNYYITVFARDIFYNLSQTSNAINATTL